MCTLDNGKPQKHVNEPIMHFGNLEAIKRIVTESFVEFLFANHQGGDDDAMIFLSLRACI